MAPNARSGYGLVQVRIRQESNVQKRVQVIQTVDDRRTGQCPTTLTFDLVTRFRHQCCPVLDVMCLVQDDPQELI